MIYCYVMSGDGLEGSWFFETLPGLGEDVQFKGYGCYRIARVVHWPTNSDMEELDAPPRREGVTLYVTLVSETFGYTPPASSYPDTTADSWRRPADIGPMTTAVYQAEEPGLPALAVIFEGGKVVFHREAETPEAANLMLEPVNRILAGGK